MPIGPQQSLMKTNIISQERLEKAYAEIDAHLSNPSYMRDTQYGGEENPWWDIMIRFQLTPGEKERIIFEYTRAGWSKVEVMNSSENNERPGLCGIRLYK